ncbi:MAG: V-type ATPase subunit [Candidatus Omnitrophica bacterium]|nr:V-type ATPase subunit [Candidatus Omnitrophota bacterium]MDE2223575.1 V-type ATPase subunit [Candidatus Omnitrophota bacterium]
MQDLSRYAYINAKIRSQIGKLLVPDQIDRLIDAPNMRDAVLILSNSAYARFIENEDVHLEELEKRLTQYDISLHLKISAHLWSEARRLLELLLERYELKQVKILLRARHQHMGADEVRSLIVPGAFTHTVDADRFLASQGLDDLLNVLKDTPYKEPLARAWEDFQRTGFLFYVENALDADYFQRVWQQIDGLPAQDRQAASRLWGIETDMENISRLIRLKSNFHLSILEALKSMLPRGFKVKESLLQRAGTGEFSVMIKELTVGPYWELVSIAAKDTQQKLLLLEVVLYHALFNETGRVLAGFPFTIGTVLAYLILKGAETRRVLSILYSKSFGQSPERIRGVLC